MVTARAPIVQTPATRLPDKRPSLVVLDPGDRPRLWDALLDALTTVLEARPDLECIMELRNRREHRLWRQLRQRELLSRISVESTAGPLESLVAAATMVVAPDPSMPCRTIISTAMAGGAVLLAAPGEAPAMSAASVPAAAAGGAAAATEETNAAAATGRGAAARRGCRSTIYLHGRLYRRKSAVSSGATGPPWLSCPCRRPSWQMRSWVLVGLCRVDGSKVHRNSTNSAQGSA